MNGPKVSPFGAWKSSITTDLMLAGSVALMETALEGDVTYWVERRPEDAGRCVLVRATGDGLSDDLTPAPYSVRSRAHEYGGGAFVVSGGEVFFCNDADQGIYVIRDEMPPTLLVSGEGLRFVDMGVDRRRNRLICICEDHSVGGEPQSSIVSVALDGSATVTSLIAGNDFYMSPRLSAGGDRLAWVSWEHPNMPWDDSAVWVGDIDESGEIVRIERVSGEERNSAMQPRWSSDGDLYFISEQTGWWNIYRLRGGEVELLCPMEAEFGRPPWIFGMSSYAIDDSVGGVCSYTHNGSWYVARLDRGTGQLEALDVGYTEVSHLQASNGRAVFIGATPTRGSGLISMDLRSGAQKVLKRSSALELAADLISIPQAIRFPGAGGATAHAFFYPPTHPDFEGPPGELPPLIVKSHGGPTAATSSALNLAIQYWTSRGFAVVDVNYGGSTGYGREYRERLDGKWGIVDVDDCVGAALYLAEQGWVDRDRLAIRGGSAGGYTTLAALAFRDVFRAGASLYGISELEALARDTHKFESRYLDGLIGPYPEARDVYRERSPIYAADQLSCPVIFLQGDEDRVVPPNQSEMMVSALQRKNIPVAYVLLKGEQHGFRQAKNIKRAIEAEVYFYARVFGFELADEIETVDIVGLQ